MVKRTLLTLLLLLVLVSLPLSLHAQVNPQQGHGAPTGVCLGPYVDTDTGNFYVCKVGQYVLTGSSVVFGCGNRAVYDNTDCGANAVTPYTQLDSVVNAGTGGTAISTCGVSIVASTNYYLPQDIGSDPTLLCLNIPGRQHVKIDLQGHKITGRLTSDTSNGIGSDIAVYNGSVTCRVAGSSTNACIYLNNNQAGAVAVAFRFHHLTIQNTDDSGTSNTTSNDNAWAFGTDFGGNTFAGGGYEFLFQYNTLLMINNNYNSGRTAATNLIGGLAPFLVTNNLVTCGSGEGSCQGLLIYGAGPGSKIDNNQVIEQPSAFNGTQSNSARALMFDFSGCTQALPCEIANNDVETNDSRCWRIRDSTFINVFNNYCNNIQFIGTGGCNPSCGTLGASHMGDGNSFPTASVTSLACGANALASGDCVLTVAGNTQTNTVRAGDMLTIAGATPSTLQETVLVQSIGGTGSAPTLNYSSRNPANNNATATGGTTSFVYSDTLNAAVYNNTFVINCTGDGRAIVFGQRGGNSVVYRDNKITTIGDCRTASFTGSLFTRYINAAVDSFLLFNTTFLKQVGGTAQALLKTSSGPGVANQQFGTYCNSTGTNGVTDGDVDWLATSCPQAPPNPGALYISSGFGTSSTSSYANAGSGFNFTINVGTGATATGGAVALPAALNEWFCSVQDVTNPGTAFTHQSTQTATTVTFTNYNSAGTVTAWAASDVLKGSCFPR